MTDDLLDEEIDLLSKGFRAFCERDKAKEQKQNEELEKLINICESYTRALRSLSKGVIKKFSLSLFLSHKQDFRRAYSQFPPKPFATFDFDEEITRMISSAGYVAKCAQYENNRLKDRVNRFSDTKMCVLLCYHLVLECFGADSIAKIKSTKPRKGTDISAFQRLNVEFFFYSRNKRFDPTAPGENVFESHITNLLRSERESQLRRDASSD